MPNFPLIGEEPKIQYSPKLWIFCCSGQRINQSGTEEHTAWQ